MFFEPFTYVKQLAQKENGEKPLFGFGKVDGQGMSYKDEKTGGTVDLDKDYIDKNLIVTITKEEFEKLSENKDLS